MPELTSADPTDALPALSTADARELARLIALLLRDQAAPQAHAMLRALGQSRTGAEGEIDREALVNHAKRVFAQRKSRNQFLPRSLFSEYGWDILLALYITNFSGGRLSIGKLASWVNAPLTTALRLIDYLEGHQLLSRQQHSRDRRAVLIDLTEKGRQVLDDYFKTLSDSG